MQDELLEAFSADALGPLATAVGRRLAESAAARAAGAPGWWRTREAALLAVGTVSERLVELAREAGGQPLALDVPGLMDSVLRQDLQGGPAVPPFLAGRALWLTARLAPAVPPTARPAFLAAAVAGLGPGVPPPVAIGACRVLAALCRGAAPAELAAASGAVFGGLCGLLGRADEDVLHLVLETLAAAVRADPGGAAAWEPQIAESTLRIWVSNGEAPR